MHKVLKVQFAKVIRHQWVRTQGTKMDNYFLRCGRRCFSFDTVLQSRACQDSYI